MKLGIQLNDIIKINLMDNIKDIIDKLNQEEIRYRILYDKNIKNGKKETILSISEYNTEIHLTNDLVNKIRSNNTKYTHVLNSEDAAKHPFKLINNCKNRLIEMGVEKFSDISIDNIDLKTLECSFSINNNNSRYIAITSRDSQGNAYINMIRIS